MVLHHDILDVKLQIMLEGEDGTLYYCSLAYGECARYLLTYRRHKLEIACDLEVVEGKEIINKLKVLEVLKGEGCMYMFVDDNNNHIVWKTSTYKNIEIGNKLILSGKVKEHKEFNNTRQTWVTRPKFKSIKE